MISFFWIGIINVDVWHQNSRFHIRLKLSAFYLYPWAANWLSEQLCEAASRGKYSVGQYAARPRQVHARCHPSAAAVVAFCHAQRCLGPFAALAQGRCCVHPSLATSIRNCAWNLSSFRVTTDFFEIRNVKNIQTGGDGKLHGETYSYIHTYFCLYIRFSDEMFGRLSGGWR